MVIKQDKYPEILSIYLLNNTDEINNTKDKQSRALIAPNNVFNRFLNYTIEERKAVINTEERMKNSLHSSIKFEMPKKWSDKLKSINEKREKCRFQKEKDKEIVRNNFVKEMNEKKASESAKILQQAKRLLLYRQPQCRIINEALLTSECIKELDAQREFELYLQEIDKKQQLLYKESIQNNIEKFKREEKTKMIQQQNMKNQYRDQLLQQILETKTNCNLLNEIEKKSKKEDFQTMARELENIKSFEIKKKEQKKIELKKMFTDAIEQKDTYRKHQKLIEDKQDQMRQEYLASKQKIQNILKLQKEERRQEYLQRIELLANQLEAAKKITNQKEQTNIINILKEMKNNEQEIIQIEKEKKAKIRLEIEQFLRQDLEFKKQRLQEIQNMKNYDILERIRKSKFHEEVQLQEYQRQIQKKKIYAEDLRKQIMAKKALEKEQSLSDAIESKQITYITNKKILCYGDEVLNESKGIRPLFPIIKAVNQVKKEIRINDFEKCNKAAVSLN